MAPHFLRVNLRNPRPIFRGNELAYLALDFLMLKVGKTDVVSAKSQEIIPSNSLLSLYSRGQKIF